MTTHVKCEVLRLIRPHVEETCIMDLGPGPFTIEIIGKNVNIKLFEVISLEIDRE